MTTTDLSEVTFQQSYEHAKKIASHLLRSSLGVHTSEDVLCNFIEKELRRGQSLTEIMKTLNSPGIYRRLANTKNDIFDWETAIKRGSGQTPVSYEDAQPILGTITGNPELELIRKEEFSMKKNILAMLIGKVKLSDTQEAILKLDQKGYSNKRIARELGIKVEAVYARRSEALCKLAKAARHLSKSNPRGE